MVDNQWLLDCPADTLDSLIYYQLGYYDGKANMNRWPPSNRAGAIARLKAHGVGVYLTKSPTTGPRYVFMKLNNDVQNRK